MSSSKEVWWILQFVKNRREYILDQSFILIDWNTAWKVSKYGVISGPYFPVVGPNTEIYYVNLRIQSKYRKIGTRNNTIFGHFSRSEIDNIFLPKSENTLFSL